jgi:anaerobic magnesium-protoporphyrin IX monomethyl ester cyclase
MTDILLIQPPVRDFYLTAKRTIPYGLACIAAALLKEGFSVEILDALAVSKSRIIDPPDDMSYLREYYGRPDRSPFALFHAYKHFGYSFEHIGKAAATSQAFLVGISSLFTPYWPQALKTAETVKACCPGCKIVLGGHHPSAMPEMVMESPAVDFILRGEGEVSMALLAEAVKNGRPYENIPGLVYRRPDGEIIINDPALMSNPDHYPLPAGHLINQKFYQRAGQGSAVIVTSRGCPMKCSYCSVGAFSYLKFRRRSVDSVIMEMEAAVDRHNVNFIDFEDENLSLDRRWFLKLLDAISSRFGRQFLELRAMNGLFPPSLDDGVIRAMKAAGFKTLNLSIGSFSAIQLKRFQRPDVAEAFDRALNLAESDGLKAVAYIIVAAPFQSAEDSISDLLLLAARRVLVGISVFYPAPGSLDYGLCENLGVLPPHVSCLRSSAIPLSHTTTRLESITLLRLGRIVNFMKSLVDLGMPIPDPLPPKTGIKNPVSRRQIGIRLLQAFLHDGKIRGIDADGDLFEHHISIDLTRKFLEGLRSIRIKGAGKRQGLRTEF